MLGALLARREVVSPDSLVEAMRQVAGRTAQHLVEINCRALARGIELAGAHRAAVR